MQQQAKRVSARVTLAHVFSVANALVIAFTPGIEWSTRLILWLMALVVYLVTVVLVDASYGWVILALTPKQDQQWEEEETYTIDTSGHPISCPCWACEEQRKQN